MDVLRWKTQDFSVKSPKAIVYPISTMGRGFNPPLPYFKLLALSNLRGTGSRSYDMYRYLETKYSRMDQVKLVEDSL